MTTLALTCPKCGTDYSDCSDEEWERFVAACGCRVWPKWREVIVDGAR